MGEMPALTATRESGPMAPSELLMGEDAWPAPPPKLDSSATRVEEELEDWATSAKGAARRAKDKTREVCFTRETSREIKAFFRSFLGPLPNSARQWDHRTFTVATLSTRP
jgi:hypothetical protein